MYMDGVLAELTHSQLMPTSCAYKQFVYTGLAVFPLLSGHALVCEVLGSMH